jgi:hypothetical protein
MFLLYHSEGCDIYGRGLSWVLYQRLVNYIYSGVLGHRNGYQNFNLIIENHYFYQNLHT